MAKYRVDYYSRVTESTTCTLHDWTATDGEAFPYSRWGADQKPRAIVVAVHGLSGAALDFEPLGAHMVKHGVVTYALELRGQGNDPAARRRGDLTSIEDWFADLSSFFALVRARHPGTQIYLYGESMGAALLTRFLAQAREVKQPDGLVLASPVIAVPGNPGWWKQTVFRFFLWATPTKRIDVSKYARHGKEDPSTWVTRDAAHRAWFETAPHKIQCFTFRFFKCVFDLFSGCLDAAPRITVPVLVIYAAHDVFIPPARVEEFFNRLGSREKESRFFPESYHLLLHDHDKADALAQIETWLLSRIELTERAQSVPAAP